MSMDAKRVAENATLMKRATYAAVSVAVLLVIIKAVALWFTGSVAMLGTLLDSLLDGSASLLNLVAVRHALTPADQEHRFGHGKAESLAGLAQAMFIAGSALFLVLHAIDRLLHPRALESLEIGRAHV